MSAANTSDAESSHSENGSEGPADELRALADLAQKVADSLIDDVEKVAVEVVRTFREGGRLFFCGNGGSAADAQHLAAEYVVRFKRERGGLPAVALTTDTSILTAGGNDYGFETVFARQVQAHGRPGDLLFLHSTSGESENLIRAAESAGEIGVKTVAMLAKGGGRLKDAVDVPLVLPTDSTARAQELHLAIGHVICEIVDREMTEGSGDRTLAQGTADRGVTSDDLGRGRAGKGPDPGRTGDALDPGAAKG